MGPNCVCINVFCVRRQIKARRETHLHMQIERNVPSVGEPAVQVVDRLEVVVPVGLALRGEQAPVGVLERAQRGGCDGRLVEGGVDCDDLL